MSNGKEHIWEVKGHPLSFHSSTASIFFNCCIFAEQMKIQIGDESRQTSYTYILILGLWIFVFLFPHRIDVKGFSLAGYCFADRRMSILPANAESQMFLHLNMDLWNIDTVKILSQAQD